MFAQRPETSFAEDYATAREKFLGACAIAGVKVERHEHPLKGPAGETLTIDTCYIGAPAPERLLVLTSGVHGVELMTGSGCQTGLLAGGYFATLPEKTGVLLIHGANPWGAAFRRRNNEDNVDLCRNFVDFEQSPLHNREYDEIKAYLPYVFARGDKGDAARSAVEAYKKEHGDEAFGRGFMAGQYHDAPGVSFGGAGPVWSRRVMETIWRRYADRAHRVCLVDYHSGLGPYGYCTAVCLQTGEAIERARRVFGEWVLAPRAAGHQSDGKAPDVQGHTTDGHERVFAGAEITSVVLEYGVKPYEHTAEILMREHRLTQEANDTAALDAARTELLHAFYPADLHWRRAVWSHSLQAVEQAMTYLEEA